MIVCAMAMIAKARENESCGQNNLVLLIFDLNGLSHIFEFFTVGSGLMVECLHTARPVKTRRMSVGGCTRAR